MDDRYTIRITTQTEQAQQDIDRLNKSLVKLGTTKISTAQVQKLHRSFVQTGGDINVLNRNISAVNGLLKSGFSITQIQKLRQKAKETGTQFAQMARLAKQTGTVNFDTTKIERSSRLINSISQGINKSFTSISNSMVSIGIATAAIIGSVKAIDNLMRAASDAEQAVVKLKYSMQDMLDVNIIVGFTKQMQKLVAVDDDLIAANIAMSKSFNQAFDTDTLKNITKLAIGLNKVFGVELETAFKMVRQAYDGNTRALSRYIGGLKEAKTQQQRLNLITAATQNYFNIAIQATDTYQGKIESLKLQFDDAKQSIGEMILRIIDSSGILNSTSNDTVTNIEKIGYAVQAALGSIVLFATGISSAIAGIFALIVSIVKLSINVVKGFFTSIFGYIKNYIDMISNNIKAISDAWDLLLQGKFKLSAQTLIKNIQVKIPEIQFVGDSITNFNSAVQTFKNDIKAIIGAVGDSMKITWNNVVPSGASVEEGNYSQQDLAKFRQIQKLRSQLLGDDTKDIQNKTDLAKTQKALNNEILEYLGLSKVQKQILQQTNEVLNGTRFSIDSYDSSLARLQQEIIQNNKELRTKQELLESQITAHDNLVSQYKLLTPEQKQNNKQLKQNIDILKGLINTTEESIEAINNQTEAFRNQTNVLDQQYQKYKLLQSTLYKPSSDETKAEFTALQNLGTEMELTIDLVKSKIVVDLQDTFLQTIRNISQSFGYAISNMITGTKSFAASMKQLWKSLVTFIIKEITTMITQYLILIAVKAAALGPLSGTGFGSFLLATANSGLGLLNTNGDKGGSTIYPNSQVNITYNNQNSITKKLDRLIDAIQNFEPVQTQIISPRALANVNKMGNAMLIQGI